MTEREKLYKLDRYGYATVKVPWNPLLLAALGQFNALKEEDRPQLAEVEKLRHDLSHHGISLP